MENEDHKYQLKLAFYRGFIIGAIIATTIVTIVLGLIIESNKL